MHTLLEILKHEKQSKISGGIYHQLQIEMTYNSNRIEGSRLTHDQTRYIYETNTIGLEADSVVNVDDIVETINHFRCIDKVIDCVTDELGADFIKELHFILKNGTSDSRIEWFAVGDYKTRPNVVGGSATTTPKEVSSAVQKLLAKYHELEYKDVDAIIEFHYQFEKIHPFQDGNGRVGRLIVLKECLKNGIVPFMIDEDLKLFYYRGLKEYPNEKGYLRDTCLTAQDRFQKYLDYFEIAY
ncbi:MAG: Fic family protein [Bacillota bacterium]